MSADTPNKHEVGLSTNLEHNDGVGPVQTAHLQRLHADGLLAARCTAILDQEAAAAAEAQALIRAGRTQPEHSSVPWRHRRRLRRSA